jgi:hypothetical protein
MVMAEKTLQGKWSLVTGASSGLGVSLARQLAARGSHVILVARREDRLREVQQAIVEAYGVEVEIITADLTDPEARQQMYGQAVRSGRPVEVLVNNAGLGLFGRFTDIPWERQNAMLQLDVVALAHLTSLFVPGMVARKSGYVLHVASIGAYMPGALYASYNAAKSFVLSFGEAVDYELRGTGVSVTVVSPGITRTEFHEVAGQDYRLFHRLTVMDADRVAEIGIRAMLKRRPSVVAGWINAVGAWMAVRVLPRRVSKALVYYAMR